MDFPSRWSAFRGFSDHGGRPTTTYVFIRHVGKPFSTIYCVIPTSVVVYHWAHADIETSFSTFVEILSVTSQEAVKDVSPTYLQTKYICRAPTNARFSGFEKYYYYYYKSRSTADWKRVKNIEEGQGSEKIR